MTLAKRKTRIITVDGIRFRCAISPGQEHVVFVAEKEDAKGRKIEVYFETNIDIFWVEFPNVDHLNLATLSPKDFASILSQALRLGWNPDSKGKAMVFDYKDNVLTERIGN